MATLAPLPTDAALFHQRGIAIPKFPKFKTKEIRGGHRHSVRSVGWNTDGRRLASASADKIVRIWTPERTVDVRASTELRGHTESVDQLAWDPTHPDRIATCSADKSVRLWDIRSAKPTHTIATPGANINITYHPSGTEVAVGDKNDTISFIDTRKGQIVRSLNDKNKDGDEINEITWNHSGTLFFLTKGQGTVRILDYATLEPLHTLVAHTATVFCIGFDPLGRFVATGSADAMVGLWDTREWMNVSMSGKLTWPTRSLSFSYDGEFLASGGQDPCIDISSTATGNTVHQIPVTGDTNTLAWHPSKYMLAYAGDDTGSSLGSVRVFGLD